MNHKTFAFLLSIIACNAGFSSAIPESPHEVRPLEIGNTVPSVTVETTDGQSTQLDALTADTPSIIVFYRGGWCPYCTRQLAALGKIESELKARGYQILALSTDNVMHAAVTDGSMAPGYQILADSRMEAAKAFGVAYKVDKATLKKLKSYQIDIEAASGESHHLLPVPAVFVINSKGIITYRYFNADYTVRLSTEELLEVTK